AYTSEAILCTILIQLDER
ncbi:hypothetical protein V3C99_004732, partial [Haemonchus contortus]